MFAFWYVVDWLLHILEENIRTVVFIIVAVILIVLFLADSQGRSVVLTTKAKQDKNNPQNKK